MKRLSFLLFAIACSCTHKPFALQTSQKDTTGIGVDSTVYIPDTSVCFERDVLPIFVASCAKAGCHDLATHKDGYNLSSYNTVIVKGLVKYNSGASKLYTKCVSGKMPQSPTPKLDSTQLSFIRRWIDKGAPHDTDCPVVCDTNKHSYASDITPIIQNKCYGCHASAVSAISGGSVVLDTYTGIFAQARNGHLLGSIEQFTSLSPMPQGGNKLPSGQIIQIRKWIQSGAPND